MLEFLKNIDTALFLLINGNHYPFIDEIMYMISKTYIWIPLFLFILYKAYLKNGWKYLLIILSGILLCILLADQSSVHLFKNIFKRFRPSHHLEIGKYVHSYIKANGEAYKGGLYGFVSSHAANYFAVFTFIYLNYKKYTKKWFLLYFAATLIIYSRIYLGVHYPSDVIGGALLGMIIGILVHYSFKKFKLISD